MTFKNNITELKSYVKKASVDNRAKINEIVNLYEGKQIPNYKTAFKAVEALASKNKNTIKSGKPEKLYSDIITKYKEAESITGRLSNPVFKLTRGDYSRAKSHTRVNVFQGNDKDKVFNKSYNVLVKEVENILKVKSSFKLRLRANVNMIKEGVDENGEETRTEEKGVLSNKAPVVITKANYKTVIKEELKKLQDKANDSEIWQSGFYLGTVNELNIDVYQTNPARGSSYIPTPEKYSNPKCGLVNIKNQDQECFKWCMKYHQTSRGKDCQNISALKKVQDKYNYDGIEFPVSYDDIYKFEALNNICIYVYSIDDDKVIIDKPGSLDYLQTDIAYLLRIEDENKSHYVYIKNIDHFFNTHNQSIDKDKRLCPVCCNKINFKEYNNHLSTCYKFAKNSTLIKLPEEDKAKMEFYNHKNKLERPYLVYADFECSLCETDGTDETKVAVHKPNSACFYFVCTHDSSQNRLWTSTGENCVVELLKELHRTAKECIKEMRKNTEMKLTKEEDNQFKKAKFCSICNKEFNSKEIKVRDHCHRTGKFRGASHQKCNINYYNNRYLPVIFHNLRGYDSHLIIKQAYDIINELTEIEERTDSDGNVKIVEHKAQINCIPCSYEKFISFNIGELKFIDSFQFMASSLEKLVENLYDPEDKHRNFNHIKNEFPEHYKLLCQKGFYPYEWMNDISKFDYQGLPNIESFYSSLKQEGIKQEDYDHAKKVYNTLECKKFLDYHMIYLKTDVLLLADVFENFRKTCMNYYGLDPANYLSSPGLAWDAMLLKTGVKLDLITDIKMLDMIERSKRGGLCFVGSKRYVKANNKYVDDYDPNQESNYLMYWDANNLYGWAMSQYLPDSNLRFIDISLEEILKTPDDNDKGYFIECDLSYPKELHDKFKEFPPCPENLTPHFEWLSDYQKEIGKNNGNIKNDKYHGTNKLVPHLFKHEKYVIHYRNLKFIHNLGVKIDKVHNVISFNQSPWLKSYIDFNTDMRKKAKNDFEKDFFKLMNNAVFGKTMENVQNRIDLKLTTDNKYAIKYFSKLNFKDSKYIKGLHLIEMFRTEIVYNKPIYVGTSVLDLSKLCMMDFHYNTIHKNFEGKYNLLYSDTDSLVYSIKHDDIYEWIKINSNHFDLSDSTREDLKDNKNKKVLGKFKDELNTLVMTEFISLNPKVYSIKHQQVDRTIKNKKTLKGVSKVVVKNEIKHGDYQNVLNTNEQISKKVMSIRSINQQIYTIKQNKIALTSFYDKMKMLDSINCIPFGYLSN